MKRSWRSSAALVAVAAMSLSLTACGSGSDESGSDGDYTIGVLNSMTGDLGAVGQQEEQGMELAVKEINADGGIDGHKIKLKTVDDQGSVNQSTAGFKKLATTDKVPLVIGPGISAQAKAVAPLADQYDVAHVLLVAQPSMANGTKNVFEVPPPGAANSEAMVEYAAEKGIKTASLIYANNPYGQEGLADITKAAEEAGIEMVSDESFEPSKFDFTAQAGKVAKDNPDVVFLYGAGGPSDALVLKAVRASGYEGKIIGDLTYSTSTIPDTAGPAADTVVSLTAVGYGDPSAEEQGFIDAFKAEFGNVPTVLSAYAYVAVKLSAAAIEKAGSFKGADIAKAMQDLDYESMIGTFEFTDEYRGGPGAAAFKPVSFKGKDFAPPVF